MAKLKILPLGSLAQAAAGAQSILRSAAHMLGNYTVGAMRSFCGHGWGGSGGWVGLHAPGCWPMAPGGGHSVVHYRPASSVDASIGYVFELRWGGDHHASMKFYRDHVSSMQYNMLHGL